MGTEQLDELLKRMPDIAKAVNAFSSEGVQQRAFGVLLGSFGADEDVAPEGDPIEEDASGGGNAPKKPRNRTVKAPAKKAAGAAKKKAPVGNPKMVNDLNLRPSGKDSLKKFAADKAPKTQHEKNAVILYYLKEILKVAKVNADHVFTAYREMKDEGWKTPNNLRNSLQVTKSVKGWADTSDMDDITMPIAGTNMVEHDLPKQPTKK